MPGKDTRGLAVNYKFKTQSSKFKTNVFIIIFISLISSYSWAFFADVREPAVAGMFYPENKAELSKQVEQFLKNVKDQKVKGRLIALIAPHAGYDYSGQVAAYAYKALEGKHFKRVILIGPSHRFRFDGISVGEFDYYKTPLGKVEVDKEFAKKIVESHERINFLREVHLYEHSLEVQIPFLQTVLKEDFKIVPIVFGNSSYKNCQVLSLSLAGLVDDETLLICSTDWSHYYAYEKAKEMDKKGIEAVVQGDVSSFARMIEKGSCEACGAPAVITTMLLASSLGANQIQLLQYANSGDVTGDKSRVVGYAAIAFSYESAPLSDKEKKKLLEIARKTLKSHLSGKKIPEFEVEKGALTEKRGAFVTLTRNGKLRGCIGYIQPFKPLVEAVQEMAIAAATKDMRFPSVIRDELQEIEIEISVLSRLKRVRDVEEIEIGRDGLYIIAQGRSGLLLPQVAIEWEWDRDQFLEQVCYKAGLPKDAWKEEDLLLYRFSAEVFHE